VRAPFPGELDGDLAVLGGLAPAFDATTR
jgi:hypothetical protein